MMKWVLIGLLIAGAIALSIYLTAVIYNAVIGSDMPNWLKYMILR